MDESSEAFGDPRFTSVELLPTPEDSRTLETRPAFALWAMLVLHPFIVDLAVAKSAFELRTFVPLLGGAALVGLMGFALLRTPQRHGLGFVATARASFGARGTHLAVAVRWLSTVVWVGAWTGYLSTWLLRLLLASVSRFVDPQWSTLVARYRTPAMLGIAALLAWGALTASRATVLAHARRAPRRIILAFALSVVLVILAFVQVGSFGSLSLGFAKTDAGSLVAESLTVALATLPALLAFTEWARFRARAGVDPETGVRLDRRRRATAPFVLIPVALLFSVTGALIHAAAAEGAAVAPSGLIGSASAIGGVLGGFAAALLGLVFYFSIVPFVGIEAPVRAAITLPIGLGELGVRRLTAALVAASAWCVTEVSAPTLMVVAGVALLPLTVVLMVDDGIVRRGRVLLEELYRAPSRYGPLFGLGISGVVALGVGYFVVAARWNGTEFLGFPEDLRAHLKSFSVGGGSSVVILAGTAAAVVFGVLRLLEGYLPLVPARPLRGPGSDKLEPAPSSVEVPRSAGEGPSRADWSAPVGETDLADTTGPIDPTMVDLAAAEFASVTTQDDEWPEESEDDSVSEAAWYDGIDDVSNPSITELEDPQFVKKESDE